MPVMAGGIGDLADLTSQRLGHTFVGVDFEYPLSLAGLNAGVAAIALCRPITIDNARRKPPGDGFRSVRAFVQEYNNLVSKGECRQAVGQLMFLVMDANNRRYPSRIAQAVAPGILPPKRSKLPMRDRRSIHPSGCLMFCD